MMKKILKAAGSLRFALVIFAVLIFVSSIGTFIKQHAPAEETTGRLREIFGDAAPAVYSFLDKTGFTDLYHTYWFNFILLLLALNLIFCSIDKLPATWKKLTGKISTDKDAFSAYFFEEKEFKASTENVSKAFSSVFSRWNITQADDVIAAEKGRYGKSGAFVTHLGLVVLIAGGFIGGIFGYNGNIAILEGKMENVVSAGKGKEINLPFSVYLENFESEFYKNSPKQSSFRSKIHFIKDNVTTEAVVAVNSPVKYGGTTFYQSSYGVYPNKDVVFKLTVDSLISGVSTDYSLGLGQEFSLPELGLRAKLNDFAPALGKDKDGNLR
ncbi:MAG: cytochrome c biogenesis protein ResB, partial [Deferribacterales bacterium]